jgi:hypothetical protein
VQLAQCRHCLDFDSKTGLCRSARREEPVAVEAEAVPSCGFHRSRLEVRDRAAPRLLPWAAAAVVVIALATAALQVRSARGRHAQAMQAAALEFVGGSEVAGEGPTIFCFKIRNTGRRDIRDLHLHLSAELLNACELVAVNPPYHGASYDSRERMHCYRFGPLAAGATLRVELTLRPRIERFCRVSWRAEACGDSGEVLAREASAAQIIP